MKIFRKIVIEIKSGRILEEHSYENGGPIAQAKGTPQAVPLTAAESEAQQLQLESLRRSARQEEELEPFVLRNLRLTRDPESGTLRRLTDEEFLAGLSPTERQAEENLRLSQERQEKALRGELPLTEAGQQKKADEFRTFKERMARAGNIITGDTPETAISWWYMRAGTERSLWPRREPTRGYASTWSA